MDLRFDSRLGHYRRLNIPSGDLRVSIVAGCNMRCYYCHNEGQGDFSPFKMSLAELRQVVTTGIKFGVHKVRLTGGEPLVHPDVVDMVRMVKKQFYIANVGVNTNGVLLKGPLLLGLIDAGLDVAVVGLDYFAGTVSKASPVGRPSAEILTNVLAAKALGLNVQVASVYSRDNERDIYDLVDWCLTNSILIKVLEVSSEAIENNTCGDYEGIVKGIIARFDLSVGKTVSLNEYYGIHKNGTRVLFFHSKCRIRECSDCSRMHMRVTASGKAKPCILRVDTEFDLLDENSMDAMARAVHNLGNPPEGTKR